MKVNENVGHDKETQTSDGRVVGYIKEKHDV